MLREITTRYTNSRIMGFETTTTSTPTITLGQGAGEATAARSGAGLYTLTLARPYNRVAAAVGTCGAGLITGNILSGNTAPTMTALAGSFRATTEAGVGADGTSDIIMCGWDLSTATGSATDLVPNQKLYSNMTKPVMLGIKVNSSGTLVTGVKEATVVKNGTGDYTVTWRRGFGRTPLIAATVDAGSVGTVNVVSKSAASVQVRCFNDAAGALNTGFQLIAYGSLSRDQSLRRVSIPIMNTQRKPRFIAATITYVGGIPTALSTSKEFSSITDNGTGDFNLNFSKPFARPPVIVGMAGGTGATRMASIITTPTTSTVRMVVTDAGGTGADSPCDVFILGSDDASEW